jgi:hypothetical protein
MTAHFAAVFAVLKPVLAKYAKRMSVKADTPTENTLLSKSPSPFHQHKGEPLSFGSVRLGKAYVSVHLMPLYMCPELTKTISPTLKRRMQGGDLLAVNQRLSVSARAPSLTLGARPTFSHPTA